MVCRWGTRGAPTRVPGMYSRLMHTRPPRLYTGGGGTAGAKKHRHTIFVGMELHPVVYLRTMPATAPVWVYGISNPGGQFMNLAFLLELVRKLGPKLPQAWPDVLIIVAATKRIFALLTGTDVTPASFGAAAPPAAEDVEELKQACAANGVDPAECDDVVATAHAIERTVAA